MPRSPKVAARRADALRMRREGRSYAYITDELGYSSEHVARRDVSRAMSQVVTEEARHHLTLELARLDEWQTGLHAKALAGDPTAVRELVRLSEHRSRLLRLTDAAAAVREGQELDHQRGILANFLDVAGAIAAQDQDTQTRRQAAEPPASDPEGPTA